MKITSMKEVRENLGKKVMFQDELMNNPVQATIVFGEFTDCEGDELGINEEYSVVYDKKTDDGYTWYGSIDDELFEEDCIKIFETLE